MKAGFLAGLAMTAMTGAAGAAGADELVCDKPMDLIAIEMNNDGVVFFGYNDGADPIRFMIDNSNVPDGVVALEDLVEEGIVSASMGDFMRSDLQKGLIDQTESRRHDLVEMFDSVEILLTPSTYDVTVKTVTAEGGSLEKTYDFNDMSTMDSFSEDYDQYNGSAMLENVRYISQMLKNTMIGHAEVASVCSIETTTLSSQGGMLRPQMRPQTP